MVNPIEEFNRESDPRKNVDINVPNIRTGTRQQQSNIAPSPIAQARSTEPPDISSAEATTEDVTVPPITDATQLTEQDVQQLRSNEPVSPGPQTIDTTSFQQNIISDIEHLAGFGSVGQAQLKGAVHPTYYETPTIHQDLIDSSLEFNNYLRKTSEKIRDELVGTALFQNNLKLNSVQIDPVTFEPVTINLDGSRSVGDHIATFGLSKSANQERTVWQQVADVATRAMGLEEPTVDITNTPGYYRFQDGTEFAPLAGLTQIRDSWRRNPLQTFMSFIPSIFNPVGGTGALIRGSKFADYGNGPIGLALYTWDGINNNWWMAGAVDAIDHFRGVDRNVQDGGTLLQAFRGRDHNFSALKRITSDGVMENPQSLFAGKSPEPKDVRELSERSWMWSWLKLTPEEFQDRPTYLPKNFIGLSEFGTGLFLDNMVDTATGAAFGAAIGSVVPVVGTAVGGTAGGIVGFIGNLFRKTDEIGAFAKQLTKTDEVLDAAEQLSKQADLFAQPQAIGELSNQDLIDVDLVIRQLNEFTEVPDGMRLPGKTTFWDSDNLRFADADVSTRANVATIPQVEPRPIPPPPPRPRPETLTEPRGIPAPPPRPRPEDLIEPRGIDTPLTRPETLGQPLSDAEITRRIEEFEQIQGGIRIKPLPENQIPLDVKVLGDSLDEAIAPELVYVPRIDGQNINRTPLIELSNKLDELPEVLLSPRAFSSVPQIFEPGENLANQAISTLQIQYNRLGQQTAELQAQLVQEKLFVDDLLEQLPEGVNVGRQDILTEVPDIVDLPPVTQLPRATDGAINLRSVSNTGFTETFYHGTRVENLTSTAIDPIKGAAASEAGIGIHLTTNALEAQTYAKAGRAANAPPIGRNYSNTQGQFLQVRVDRGNVLNGSVRLHNNIKNTLKANLADPASPQFRSVIENSELSDNLADLISDAIDSSTNYKSLIANLDEALLKAVTDNEFTAIPEQVRLQLQRAVALNLRNMGIEAIVYGKGVNKQLTVLDPRILTVVGSQKVRVGNLLEQMVNRVNADAFAAARFKKSAYAKANAIDSKLQYFNQKVFTTQQQAAEANTRLGRVADAMSKRDFEIQEFELNRLLKEQSVTDSVFSTNNQKTIQRNISKTLTQEFKETPFVPKDLADPVNKTIPFKLKPLTLPKIRKGIVRTSEIDKRVARLRANLQAVGKRYNTFQNMSKAEQNRLIALVDARLAMMMDELVNLNVTKINAVEEWLSTRFNLKHKGLVGLTRSEAGRLRENIRNAGLLANGIIDDMVRLHLVRTVKQHDEILKNILRGRIKGEALGRLRLDIIELGAIPKLEAHYSLMPAGRRFNEARYQGLIKQLEDLGLTGDEIKEIIKSSMNVSASMDEARLIGNALGLNIGNEELIGYMARIQSNEARAWMEKLKIQSEFGIEGERAINGTDIAIQRSRSHFHYIPEDVHVVGWQLGITPQEVNRLIDSEQFTPLIAQIAKASPELLDEMIQVGSISKLPFTTNEVARVIADAYGDSLPFAIRKELFLTDPAKAYDAYVDYLKSSTAQSNIVKRIISDGTEFGWAMPERAFRELAPDEQKQFIKWTAERIQKHLPNYNEKNPVYVHRAVHNQFVSMVGFIQDPSVMNSVAQNMSYFNRFFNNVNKVVNEALLLNPGYAPRIAYDSMRSFFSAGGNMLRYFEGHIDMMKIIRNGSADHLDDVKKVYRGINGELVTEREFFRTFVQLEGSDFVPKGSGTRLTTQGKDIMQVFNFKRGVNYAIHFGRQFGIGEGIAKGFGSLRDFQGSVFSANAALGTWFETSAKWALYKSWGDTRGGNRIGQFASQFGAQYENPLNMRDMQRMIEDYFTSWSDVGPGTKFVNSFRPFSVYAMWNSPAQVRQMIRRPREFVNYMRIRSFINRDMSLDEQNNEWSYPSFVLDNRGIGLWKDEHGRWVSMVPSNWDSRADFLSGVTRTSKQVLKDQGYFEGIASERIVQIINDDSDFALFGDFLKEASPLIKTAVALGTSKDPVTGRSIKDPDTSLGRKTGLNWQTEYLLSAYPVFGNLMRSNPFEVFGVPEIVDQKTGQVISPAKPGVLGSKRVDYDTSKYENPWGVINVLRRLGFSVQVIDHDKNVNWTYRKLDQAVNQTKADIRKLDREVKKMEAIGHDTKFPQEYRLKRERLIDASAQLPWLIKDQLVLKAYTKFKGITPTSEIRDLEREALDKIPSRFGEQIYQQLLDDLAEFEDLYNANPIEQDTIESD